MRKLRGLIVLILAIKQKQRGLRWGRRLEEAGKGKVTGNGVKI